MEIDQLGFSLWHYWAESPRPCDLWSSVLGRLIHEGRDHHSRGGEHPWHRLALRGQPDAMKKWETQFGNPLSPEKDIIGIAGHDSVLMRAAWAGEDGLISWLMELGAGIHDADEHGLTPLMVAIHRCSPATVKALLHHGADPEAADERGRTALHHAAQCEQTDLYSMIEDCGGDGERPDLHGQTPRSLLERSTRTPQQGFIIQSHWMLRYQSKLSF